MGTTLAGVLIDSWRRRAALFAAAPIAVAGMIVRIVHIGKRPDPRRSSAYEGHDRNSEGIVFASGSLAIVALIASDLSFGR